MSEDQTTSSPSGCSAPPVSVAVAVALATLPCGSVPGAETASAVTALTAYSSRVPASAMHVTARESGATLADASFETAPASKTFTFASSAFKGNEVRLRSDRGTLHYVLLYTYALPRNVAGNLTAFRVTRHLYQPRTATPFATIDLAAPPQLTMHTGAVFDVGVRIAVDHPVDHVVIEDPLPAGYEAIDASFATSLQTIVPQTDNWEVEGRQIYRDRVVAYASHLEPGVYDMHYLVRSVTPGLFGWPGARVYLEEAPEQFGRSASAVLELK